MEHDTSSTKTLENQSSSKTRTWQQIVGGDIETWNVEYSIGCVEPQGSGEEAVVMLFKVNLKKCQIVLPLPSA